jgi:hypothetical protein
MALILACCSHVTQVLRAQQATLTAANTEVLAKQQQALHLQRQRQFQQQQWQHQQQQAFAGGGDAPVPLPSPGRRAAPVAAPRVEEAALSWGPHGPTSGSPRMVPGPGAGPGGSRATTPSAVSGSLMYDDSGSEEEDVPWVPGPASFHRDSQRPGAVPSLGSLHVVCETSPASVLSIPLHYAVLRVRLSCFC